jgi:hypothetical protein
MENSEVLEQDTSKVTTQEPTQPDVPAIKEGPAVLEQTTSNMYANAKSVTQPVGEKDHASEIAMTNEEANKTYDYDSQAAKQYDTSVTTTTTRSSGKEPLESTWNSNYKMSSDYTVDDNQDYSWNKLAEEMSQTAYDQEAGQYRAESIAAKQEIDAAAASAWNNYFAAEYSARQTQDKMGWSGGQKKASDLQVSFLQAETASNMYTQDEMQRYGVETKLGIARMYADANQKALALENYQDALDKAINEANLTGVYVPPEASEMFTQQKLARDILKNPNATAAEKERARQINNNCEAFYDALGFEKVTIKNENGEVVTEHRGIKTLSYLQAKETERSNRANERLQEDANAIASEANAIGRINLRVAQLQLQATKEQTNAINSKEIVEKGEKVTLPKDVKVEGLYYTTTENVTDKNGKVKFNDGTQEPITTTKEVKVDNDSKIIKYNGEYYTQGKDGVAYKIQTKSGIDMDKYIVMQSYSSPSIVDSFKGDSSSENTKLTSWWDEFKTDTKK